MKSIEKAAESSQYAALQGDTHPQHQRNKMLTTSGKNPRTATLFSDLEQEGIRTG